MQNLVYLLPVLGCAAMMGMMLWMMRGSHKPDQAEAASRAEIATLRAELAALRAQQRHPSPDAPAEPRAS